PSKQVKQAITNAVEWFEKTKIVGYRFDKLPDVRDKGLIKDENSIIWARFYDFDTNKPIFGDRDNSIKSNVTEISMERRYGYAWYGNFAAKLLASEYPKWQKANP
ncbi:MAG: pectate lyase, partial [Bacteroidia bacterium]